jgi:hypothetical protein
MHGVRRFLVGIGLAATVAWAAGCGGDSTMPVDLAGHYLLETINGDALPATITYQGVDFVFESGSWDLTATDFSGELTVSAMSVSVTASFSGTYTLSGSTLSLTGTVVVDPPGSSVDLSGQITVSGQDLTMVDNSLGFTITLVFSKQ